MINNGIKEMVELYKLTGDIIEFGTFSCESAIRLPSGWGWPSRYGSIGCIPLPVKSVVGSFSVTKEADGTTACPFSFI